MSNRFRIPLAAALLAVVALPLSVRAATSTVSLSAGSLSIGTLANTTLTSTPVSTGTVSGSVNLGNWSDTTGTGLGWHGTIALTNSPFVDQGAWAQTAGTTLALGSTASGAYTGSVANALVTVTVTSSTGTATTVNWSDREGATNTSGTALACTNGSACAIASGVTITFATGVTYLSTDVYTAKVGAMPVTATTLDTNAAPAPVPQGTTVGGSNLPTYENGGPTGAATVNASSSGTAQPFVTAALNSGMGSFALAPGITVTWDPNNTWDAGYTATAQYAIVSGP
ncbi:MAG: hypothetical protein ACYDAC_03675 [Candidatus Dormibacteria bacterium]